MVKSYDVVIVGARCAGATLAIYLARSGVRVALVDAGKAHSDLVLSTHLVHTAGMRILDEVGVGAEVRSSSPAWRVWRFDMDGAVMDIPLPPGHEEYCPRRYFLDGLLQDAAQAAGAELFEQTRVNSLVEDAGRVTGVRALRQGGDVEIRAPLVVGADGRNSTVARLVSAKEYLGYNAPRGAYWAYWRAPEIWNTDAYPFQGYGNARGISRRLIFETDKCQLLIATSPPVKDVRGWRGSHVDSYLTDLRSDSVIGPLIQDAHLDSDVRGTISERFFFRQAAGPGWALVGDAGHHKDFNIGDGITQALLDAKDLAEAIGEGSDQALRCYWRRRDVNAIGFYRLAEETGDERALPRLNRIVLGRLASKPQLVERFRQQFEHGIEPMDAIPLGHIMGSVLWGVSRGHFGLLREFLAQAKRVSSIKSELRSFQKSLAGAEQAA